jgi:hypothetical protein
MKKAPLAVTCILSAMLSFSVPAFSQGRFDIALEGPWIFYHESSFQFTDGTTTKNPTAALIAVAPQVPGHYDLAFSTGTGFTNTPGVYCVGFDQACMSSLQQNTPNPNDPYPNPPFVPVPTGNWDWTNLPVANPPLVPAAYVLIIPMPNSWSADGESPYNTAIAFPPKNTPAPSSTSFTPTAIGVVLHYDVASSLGTFELSPCTKQVSSPPVFQCPSPNSTTQAQTNYGMLRISIKSPDDPPSQIACDHHVHRAYHYMEKLLPSASSLQSAYLLDLQTYVEACRRCDPQLDSIPEDCAAGSHMTMTSTLQDVLGGLDEVIGQLQALQPNDAVCPDRLYELCDFEALKTGMAKKFATPQALLDLKDLLGKSQDSLLRAQKNKREDGSPSVSRGVVRMAEVKSKAQVEAALDLEKWLTSTAVNALNSATNGKDCRSAEILVGP